MVHSRDRVSHRIPISIALLETFNIISSLSPSLWCLKEQISALKCLFFIFSRLTSIQKILFDVFNTFKKSLNSSRFLVLLELLMNLRSRWH